MIVSTVGIQTLQVIEELRREGIDSYVLLMRHGERYIGYAENDEEMGLTPEGKRAAYEFGKTLPPNACIRFFSSLVGRCVETSSLIEQGYLTSGGVTESNAKLNVLYAFFVKDLPKFLQIHYEMDGAEEWPKFYRNWYEGKYSPNLVDDPAQSAQAMLRAFVDLLQEPGVGNICVSHDWNLFLIKEQFLGLRPEEYEYIQYLEGVVIYKQNGSYYITNHQTGAKALSFLEQSCDH